MRNVIAFGLGAAEARRAVRTQLEPDEPSQTPEGAQHLGR